MNKTKREPLMRQGSWQFKAATGVAVLCLLIYSFRLYFKFRNWGIGPDEIGYWFTHGLPLFGLIAMAILSRLDMRAARIALAASLMILLLEVVLMLVYLASASRYDYAFGWQAGAALEILITLLVSIPIYYCLTTTRGDELS